MDSNTIFLFGAGASKQAGIPIGDEITNMLLNYSSYCPSESGIAIENLFRYLQAKIANYLEVKSTEINYELIIGALADLSNREDNITVPFFGEMDPFIRETENTIKLKDILEKFYMLYREILFVKYPPEYLYPLKEFLTKNQTACGHPTLKDGVCFGPHALTPGFMESRNHRAFVAQIPLDQNYRNSVFGSQRVLVNQI